MNIRLVLDYAVIYGTVENTSAGRDFASLLPLTLQLSDFHHTEKISDLSRPLSTTGAPSGIAAKAGDITYYAPWGNLALFYRDFEHSDGLVRLGHLHPDAAKLLANQTDPFTVTIEEG